MKKYYLVGKLVVDDILTGRMNFFIWRLRLIISLLTIYFLWLAMLSKQATIAGYSSSLLLTYIFISFIISSFVLNSRSFSIGDDITQGNLSNHLLRPYNYFAALLSSDIAEKIINGIFAILEISILYIILKPPFFLQSDPGILFLSIIALFTAISLYFFCGLLVGCIGFWSHEVWGPRFIFTVGITILSGIMFPIDMLPKQLFFLAQFSPFTYLIYFPTKVYLGQLSLQQILMGLSIAIFWNLLFYLLLQFIWKKGLLHYTAQGR